jgi:sulfite reductase alpha subunit-like flavoprotein
VNLFVTKDGKESERYGVCSNYMEGLDKDDEVQIFIRNALGFRMPENLSHPMLLIGPGLLKKIV